LEEHEAYEFVDQAPDHANIIDGKWVLQRKLKVDGSIDKHKARLVARGDRQKEGIDCFDITSPVVDASIIKFAFGLVVQRGMHIATLDVPTAFLGSKLDETIYMRLPKCDWSDMDPASRLRPLVMLRATLYGLKQAGRYWFEDVYDFVVAPEADLDAEASGGLRSGRLASGGLGLKASIAAPGFFFGDGVFLLLYVDDIMLMADSIDRLNYICDSLYKRFRANGSVVGSEFQYLGMAIKIDRAARRVTVNQHGYLSLILEKFDMAGCNGRLNPMDSGIRLRTRKPDEPKADIEVYRQAIGCLLYAALGSRADIAYAVGVLGRYAADPGISHMQAVRHLFRYLKRTIDYKLPIYDPERASAHQNPVVAYADAYFGGDVDDAKSTSSYLIYAHGSLVD
jgi:hypothetical protein